MSADPIFLPPNNNDKSRRLLLFPIVGVVVLLLIVAPYPVPRESSRTPDHGADSFFRARIQDEEDQSATVSSPKVLNVHVVPHTHDDVGWLKTVDQYYFGLNTTIQSAAVQEILDSVIASLQENPKRTFTYVEQKFFSMWWERQNDATKDSVRLLVANKQLSFANGGWCMHDEASTHYIGMIDQTTLGHTFLKDELGVIPRVGWQLDPFGHSSTQASLMTSKMGFDALYFGRIDYQDLRLRQLQQETEGLWNATDNLQDATVFWSMTGYLGGYGAVGGFCFDMHCHDPLLVTMNSTTLLKSMKDFLRKIRIQSDQTRGSHIMLTMGSDFQVRPFVRNCFRRCICLAHDTRSKYMQARQNFANLDTLIETITDLQQWQRVDIPALFGPRFDRVDIFYSSPENYTKSKYNELRAQNSKTKETDRNSLTNFKKYAVKRDDFFPYSDCEHCYWTGYFTSRTALKRLERVASSFLLAARQIESMLDYTGQPDPIQCEEPFHILEDASGVTQHHDGVSGTAKQHVANDYSKRLQAGINEVSSCAIRKVKRLLLGEDASAYLRDLSHCQLLNETVCDVSQGATEEDGSDLYVIVYNSLAHERSSVVHLPVSVDGSYNVTNISDGTVSTVSSHPSATAVHSKSSNSVVSFIAGPLPGLGACVYKVVFVGNSARTEISLAGQIENEDTALLEIRDDEDVEVSNGLFSATFDGTTGALKKMKIKEHEMELSQSWGYYTSYDSRYDRVNPKDETSASIQNSGAYIFRPSIPEQQLRKLQAVSASFVNTSIGMEVHVQYSEPWVKTVARILEGRPYLEIEYTVGPIPIDDNRGKEIVTRFDSSVESSSTFFTDSNGREFMKRVRNYRPTWKLNMYEPVAGNYYPVNAAMYIQDSEGLSLAVATDRTQGGSSLVDGSIELMVHRRTLADDSRGVGEPLNETAGGMTPYPPFGNRTRIGQGIIVRGTHRILIGNEGGATLARSMMDSMFADPIVLVGSSNSSIEVPFIASNFSGVTQALPSNVMLLTRRVLYSEPETTFLVRVGHQYGFGEDKKLSEDIDLDLSSVFPGYEIEDVVEMTLSGNQEYEEWAKNRFDWVGHTDHRIPANLLINTTIKLAPMEIRTLQVKVKAAVRDRL